MTEPGRLQHPALRMLVLRGMGWKLASQVTLQALGLGTTIVIAHLLTPHDLGLVAMTAVFSGIAYLLADLALGAALVQRETLTEEDRSTAFWTSATVGVALTGLGVALAGPIARLYGQPEVKPLFAVLSISFVLTTLGTTQYALLVRELRFRSIEVRNMITAAVGSAAAIAVAALGYGPWAIITQLVVTSGVSTALLWGVSSWRPRFTFSRAALRALFGFGGSLFGTRILFYVSRTADNFLIGRYLGAARLGSYSFAYNIMLIPMTRVAVPVTQVFFPAFSRIRDPARIGELWLRAVRVVAAVIAPAMLGLVVVAPDLVPVVFGERWRSSVVLIQILAAVGLVQALQTLNGGILQALGRTGVLFRFAAVASTLAVGSFVAGLPFGVVGVAAAYAIASVFIEPYYAWRTARVAGIPLRSYLGALAGVAEASIAMMLAVLAGRTLLVYAGVPPALRLVALILLGIAVYVPLLVWRAPEVRDEARRVLRERRRRKTETLPERSAAAV